MHLINSGKTSLADISLNLQERGRIAYTIAICELFPCFYNIMEDSIAVNMQRMQNRPAAGWSKRMVGTAPTNY